MKQITMTLEEYRAMTDSECRAKYGNRKVRTEEGVFDSHREYGHWLMLSHDQAAGKIRNLQRQVRYLLSVGGQKIGTYVADFVFEERIGQSQEVEARRERLGMEPRYMTVVADSKGFRTPLYNWKRRHMAAEHGVVIREL